ncbi:MAG: hypothetical protein HRF40_02560 [Nitrososphaera sp.]
MAILALGYFIIITSWIGFHISTSRGLKYGDNIYTLGRLAVDLSILFAFYYLVSLTLPENASYNPQAFTTVLPVIFVLFLVWDGIKLLQVYRENGLKEGRTKSQLYRMGITFDYFILFAGLAILYLVIQSANLEPVTFHCLVQIDIIADNLLINGFALRDPFFIVTSFILILKYRYRKWKNVKITKTRTVRKRPTKLLDNSN